MNTILRFLADLLLRLLRDDDLALQMSQAARQKVASTFADTVLLPQLERLYDECQAIG